MKRIKRVKNCPRLPRFLMGIGVEVEDFFTVGNHHGFLLKMQNGGYAFGIVLRKNEKDVKKAFKWDIKHFQDGFITDVKNEYYQQKNKYLELID